MCAQEAPAPKYARTHCPPPRPQMAPTPLPHAHLHILHTFFPTPNLYADTPKGSEGVEQKCAIMPSDQGFDEVIGLCNLAGWGSC